MNRITLLVRAQALGTTPVHLRRLRIVIFIVTAVTGPLIFTLGILLALEIAYEELTSVLFIVVLVYLLTFFFPTTVYMIKSMNWIRKHIMKNPKLKKVYRSFL